MSEQQIRAALREIAGSVPVRPDASAVMVTSSPRTHKSWIVPVMAAAAVVLVLAVGLVKLPAGEQLPAAGGSASLPDRFPAFSFVQGKTDGRFGRAIALYDNGSGHEDFRFGQMILASADGDRYRQIEVPEIEGGLVPCRLSPSGTKLAIGGNGLTVVDLTSGARTPYVIDAGHFIRPMVISPDERFIAYTTAPSWGEFGTLSILELASGKITAIGTSQVRGVAFAPDSTEFAFQVGYPDTGEVVIARLDGSYSRRIVAASQSRLAGADAWSPDGKWLVMVTYGADPSYVFLSAAGTAEQVPATTAAKGITNIALDEAVLGWRSPTSMLVSGSDVDGTTSNLIVEVNIVTGSRQVVSRFTVGQRDDLAVADVQLAAGLLDGISMRHSTNPDRGVWPTWALVISAVCLALFVILVARWYRRSRRSL